MDRRDSLIESWNRQRARLQRELDSESFATPWLAKIRARILTYLISRYSHDDRLFDREVTLPESATAAERRANVETFVTFVTFPVSPPKPPKPPHEIRGLLLDISHQVRSP